MDNGLLNVLKGYATGVDINKTIKIVSKDVLDTLPLNGHKFEGLKTQVIGFMYKRNEDYYGTGWLEKQYIFNLLSDYTFTLVATEDIINGYQCLRFYPNHTFVENTEYIKEIDFQYALNHINVFEKAYMSYFHISDLNRESEIYYVYKNNNLIGTIPLSVLDNKRKTIGSIYYTSQQKLYSLLKEPNGYQCTIEFKEIGYSGILNIKDNTRIEVLDVDRHYNPYKKEVMGKTSFNNRAIFRYNSEQDNNIKINDRIAKEEFLYKSGIDKIFHDISHDVYDPFISSKTVNSEESLEIKEIKEKLFKLGYIIEPTKVNVDYGQWEKGERFYVEDEHIKNKIIVPTTRYNFETKKNEPTTIAKFFYFYGNHTDFREYFYNSKVIIQSEIRKDLGKPLFYYDGEKLVSTTMCLKEFAILYHYKRCEELFKFKINDNIFYTSDKSLATVLFNLTTGTIIECLYQRDNYILLDALGILKIYNFEPIFFDYNSITIARMMKNMDRLFIPDGILFINQSSNVRNSELLYKMIINKLPYGELEKEDDEYYYVSSPYKVDQSNCSDWFKSKYLYDGKFFKIKKV